MRTLGSGAWTLRPGPRRGESGAAEASLASNPPRGAPGKQVALPREPGAARYVSESIRMQ